MKNGFDKLAAPYRWMEYMSFGRALERCRFALLPEICNTKSALLLGDGDGRFTSALLRIAESANAVAVDGSAAMLRALQRRCEPGRVCVVQADLRLGLPPLDAGEFDLVATHFFLDCLTDAEVDLLAGDVSRCVAADARWVVSEFRVPTRGAMRWPAWLVVRGLYLSFRWMTGLRVRRLPAYRDVLSSHGWRLTSERSSLGGLLVSELWVLPSAS